MQYIQCLQSFQEHFVSIASEVIALAAAAAANFRLIENVRSAAIQQEIATFLFHGQHVFVAFRIMKVRRYSALHFPPSHCFVFA